MPAPARPLIALAVVLAATGCSSERDSEVAAATEDFFAAVAEGDGARACGLLAPSTRTELESSAGASCAEAVLDEVHAETTAEVSVYGGAGRAQVGRETAFLSLLDGVWRVTAVGCAAPFGLLFFVALAGQAVAGCADYDEQLLADGLSPVGLLDYVGSAHYAVDVTENWQSEFLAVGSMAVLAIFLRERGSPESKPVGASHEATGVEG